MAKKFEVHSVIDLYYSKEYLVRDDEGYFICGCRTEQRAEQIAKLLNREYKENKNEV